VGPPVRRYVAPRALVVLARALSLHTCTALHAAGADTAVQGPRAWPSMSHGARIRSVPLAVACAALKSVAFGVAAHVDMSRRGFYRRRSEHAALVVERLRCDTELLRAIGDLLRFERRGRRVWPFERYCLNGQARRG
jgi:hypothetical protein